MLYFGQRYKRKEEFLPAFLPLELTTRVPATEPQIPNLPFVRPAGPKDKRPDRKPVRPFIFWSGREDLNLRPPAPHAEWKNARKALYIKAQKGIPKKLPDL